MGVLLDRARRCSRWGMPCQRSCHPLALHFSKHLHLKAAKPKVGSLLDTQTIQPSPSLPQLRRRLHTTGHPILFASHKQQAVLTTLRNQTKTSRTSYYLSICISMPMPSAAWRQALKNPAETRQSTSSTKHSSSATSLHPSPTSHSLFPSWPITTTSTPWLTAIHRRPRKPLLYLPTCKPRDAAHRILLLTRNSSLAAANISRPYFGNPPTHAPMAIMS